MFSPLLEIRESDALPEIAAIYDEFKRATGLPVVNLIYRHLATIPGALPWAWSLMQGPIVAGQAENASNRVATALSASEFDASVKSSADLQPPDADRIRAILDVYHRSNILNLVCLTGVLSVLINGARTPSMGGVSRATGLVPRLEPQTMALQEAIPPLPKLASLTPELAAVVQSLAELHDQASTAGVTPSLYLHLAHWPEFLRAVRAPLTSHFVEGTIERDRSEVQRLAAGEAAALAATMAGDRPRPEGENFKAMRRALEMFTQRVIPEMIVVGLVLRTVLPRKNKPR